MRNNGYSPLFCITVISLEQILKEPSITLIPLEIFHLCLVGEYFHLRQFVLCKNGCSLLPHFINYLPCMSLLGKTPSTLNNFTLVNVYVDLVVLTRIAGTS